VKAARLNFKLNGIVSASSRFGDVLKDKSRVRQYELVCANLISPVLEKIKGVLFSSVTPGGYLAVSGVHVQNFPEFHAKFRHPKFRCLKILKRRGWTGMLFKKSG
jgi:ribosomal protein L11 methylase PrmA